MAIISLDSAKLYTNFTPDKNYQLDVFKEFSNVSSDEMSEIEELQTLYKKTNKTQTEIDRMNSLATKYLDKTPNASDFNKLCSAILNMQNFMKNEISDYVTNTVNTGVTTINTNKDSALIAIEQKKANIIDYMDGTTAGAIRNDIGDMQSLTTTAKTSLVGAINELKDNINTQNQMRKNGGGTFNSTTGVTITHNLGVATYRVTIIPTTNTQGTLGEYWIENKRST
jgi:hypothetical protein